LISGTNYRYFLKEEEAEAFKDFMLPMLELFPEKRATAQRCLHSHWLKMPAQKNCLMSPEQVAEYLSVKKASQEEFAQLVTSTAPDSQCFWAGSEDNFSEEASEADSSLEEADNPYGFPALDRSFRKVYTGYAHGIKVGDLDQTGNWQFEYSFKK
jgi:serine/threonine protein kinase